MPHLTPRTILAGGLTFAVWAVICVVAAFALGA